MTLPKFGNKRMRVATLALTIPALLIAGTTAPAAQSVANTRHDPAQIVQLPTTVQPAPQQSPQQVPQPASSPYATPAGAVLPLDMREVDRIANALVAGQRVPGLAIAIVQNGRVIHQRGYGITDVNRPEPVDAHTVFRLASLSKSFAGTMAGLLVNDGRINWNTSVTQYVPSFRLPTEAATRAVTVADLASHRVGLTKNAYDRDIEGNLDYPSAVQKLAGATMRCLPGECYAYQNVAFSLLGDVVFAATGNFYPDAVQNRIFKPLGMNDASYGLDGIQSSPRWAKPHVRAGGGWRAVMPKATYYRLAPAAGVNASIADMAQWILAQGGHRPDVLPPAVLEQVHSYQIATPTELRGSSWRRERLDSAGYGFGWRVMSYAGHKMYFHGGAVQGYRGAMALLPDRDLGVVILWNSESSMPSGLLPTILDRAIGLPSVAWIPNTVTGEEMPDIAGNNTSRSEPLESSGSD